MAPPLSIVGVWQSLRIPTSRDWLFAVKTYISVVICLLIGFSQNLENPYWSALTVYLMMAPPQSGIIRSKSLFRLVGTVLGAVLILAVFGLFANHLGYLLLMIDLVIVGSIWMREIDVTATSEVWFSIGLTAGFMGLVDLQNPYNIFNYSTERMAEILIGVVVPSMVDSLLFPAAMLPGFMKGLQEWRSDARNWVTEALRTTSKETPGERHSLDVRDRLRKLTKTVGALDTKAVQLPFDVVDAPARKRDLNMLRATLQRLIADLASIETWTNVMRRVEGPEDRFDTVLEATADWIHASDDVKDDVLGYAARGEALEACIADANAAIGDRTDPRSLAERGILLRLRTFVRDWADLIVVIRSVGTHARLPNRLRATAKDAAPVRSTDYLLAGRDVVPLAAGLTLTGALYYVTAWNSGPESMLFAFLGGAFLMHQPNILRTGAGALTWVTVSFVFVFAYQFAILPRITTFPTLMIVIGLLMVPVGILLAMSPAGMFISAFFFAFVSLSDVYSASFDQSLLKLGAGLTGMLAAIICLYIFGYDRPRFVARRLVAGLRGDIADAASARRVPSRDRFLFLTIDRLGKFFPAIDKIADDDDRLKRVDMIDDLRIGLNVIALRSHENDVTPGVRDRIDRLMPEIAAAFQAHAGGAPLPSGLSRHVDRLIEEAVASDPDLPLRDGLIAALVGLRIALASRNLPFATGAADDNDAPVPARPRDLKR